MRHSHRLGRFCLKRIEGDPAFDRKQGGPTKMRANILVSIVAALVLISVPARPEDTRIDPMAAPVVKSVQGLSELAGASAAVAQATWAVPAHVKSIVIRACGAGGSGGGAGGARNSDTDNGGGGGGGAGSPIATIKVDNLNAKLYYYTVGAAHPGGAGGRGGGASSDGAPGSAGDDTVFGPSVDKIAGTDIPVDPRVFRFPGGARGEGGKAPTGDHAVDGRGGAGGSGPGLTAGGNGGNPDARGGDGASWTDSVVSPPATVGGGAGGESVAKPGTDGGGGGGGGSGAANGGNGGQGGGIVAKPGGDAAGNCAGGGGGGANGEANLDGTHGGAGGSGMLKVYRVP